MNRFNSTPTHRFCVFPFCLSRSSTLPFLHLPLNGSTKSVFRDYHPILACFSTFSHFHLILQSSNLLFHLRAFTFFARFLRLSFRRSRSASLAFLLFSGFLFLSFVFFSWVIFCFSFSLEQKKRVVWFRSLIVLIMYFLMFVWNLILIILFFFRP